MHKKFNPIKAKLAMALSVTMLTSNVAVVAMADEVSVPNQVVVSVEEDGATEGGEVVEDEAAKDEDVVEDEKVVERLAEGVFFQEDFSDGKIDESKWTKVEVVNPFDAQVKVTTPGALQMKGGGQVLMHTQAMPSDNYTIECELVVDNDGTNGANGSYFVGFRMNPVTKNRYEMQYSVNDKKFYFMTTTGNNTAVAEANSKEIVLEKGRAYHLRIAVFGNTMTLYLDDEEILNWTDKANRNQTGAISLMGKWNKLATFDNIEVKEYDGVKPEVQYYGIEANSSTDAEEGTEGGTLVLPTESAANKEITLKPLVKYNYKLDEVKPYTFTTMNGVDVTDEIVVTTTNGVAKFVMPGYGIRVTANFVSKGNHQATTYYIDSENGSDSGDGLSEGTAWNSLEQINGKVFGPGDKILFKAGSTFDAEGEYGTGKYMLTPKGSGTTDAPIVIGMYGTGEKPTFNGLGRVENVIYLDQQENIIIENLEITNEDPNLPHTYQLNANTNTKKILRGIRVNAKDYGVVNGIIIRDNYIHNINGNLNNKWNGGIFFDAGGTITTDRVTGEPVLTGVPTKYDGILIENNTIENVDRSAIKLVSSAWCNRSKTNAPSTPVNWYPSTNVVVRNNYMNGIGGDGITVRDTDGALIEYNLVRESNKQEIITGYNVAIWPFQADNSVVQYNEAYLTYGLKDGQGFDADHLSKNSVTQYNYSHDNVGGFMLVMGWYETWEKDQETGEDVATGQTNTGVTIRYNVSQNDLDHTFEFTRGVPNGTSVYNNTIYLDKKLNVGIFDLPGFGTSESNSYEDFYVFNNIFYYPGDASSAKFYGGTKEAQEHLKEYIHLTNNAYVGITPPAEEQKAFTGDLGLVDPGRGPVGEAGVDPANKQAVAGVNLKDELDGYKLRGTSQLINKGVTLEEIYQAAKDKDKILGTNKNPFKEMNGVDYSKDFFGNNNLYGSAPDIGAFEYQGNPAEVDKYNNDLTPILAKGSTATWVMTGGYESVGNAEQLGFARNYSSHFEEKLRWEASEGNANAYKRFVTNTSVEGLNVKTLHENFDQYIGNYKPSAVSILIGEADYKAGNDEADFKASLKGLLEKVYHANIVPIIQIDSQVPSAYKKALYEVVDQFGTLVFSHTADLTTAEGHLKAANELIIALSNFNPSAMTTLASTTKLDETIVPLDKKVTNGVGNAQITEKMKNKEPLTWMFVGDNITQGKQSTYGYDSVSGLFQKFLVEQGRMEDVVVNAGVTGATTKQFLGDAEAKLNTYNPDVVFIMFGTNDAVQGNQVSKEVFKDNLKTMIEKVKATGAIPVLRTPPMVSPLATQYATYLGSYADVVREVAKEQGVTLIDHYLEWEKELEVQPYLLGTKGASLEDGGCPTPNKYWLDDVVNPSASGQLNMAQAIIRELGYYDLTSYISNHTYQFNPIVVEEKQEVILTPTDHGFKINMEVFKNAYNAKELISLTLSATPVAGGQTKVYTTYDLTQDEVKLEGLAPNTAYIVNLEGHVKNTNAIVRFPQVELLTLKEGEVAQVVNLSNNVAPREVADAEVGKLTFYLDGREVVPSEGFELVAGAGDNDKFYIENGMLKTKVALESKNATYTIQVVAKHEGQIITKTFDVKTVRSLLEDSFDVDFEDEKSMWKKDPSGTGNFRIEDGVLTLESTSGMVKWIESKDVVEESQYKLSIDIRMNEPHQEKPTASAKNGSYFIGFGKKDNAVNRYELEYNFRNRLILRQIDANTVDGSIDMGMQGILASVDYKLEPNEWYQLEITVKQNEKGHNVITVAINDGVIIDYTDTTNFVTPDGKVTIRGAWKQNGSFDNLMVEKLVEEGPEEPEVPEVPEVPEEPGNGGGSSSGGSTSQSSTAGQVIEKLNEKDKEAIAENFKENTPYTSLENTLTLEQLKALTNGKFTDQQLKEILANPEMLEALGIDISALNTQIAIVPVEDVVFEDVSEKHWALESIQEAAKLGFVAGMPDGSFAPEQVLQVADTFAFLDRVLLLNGMNEMKLPRSTVEKYITDKEHWAFANMASIASKLTETTLKTVSEVGDMPLSRELLAQVMFEVTDGKLEKVNEVGVFNDIEDSLYKEAIEYCVMTGLLSGTGNNMMLPQKALTRAECMSVLVRLNNLLTQE